MGARAIINKRKQNNPLFIIIDIIIIVIGIILLGAEANYSLAKNDETIVWCEEGLTVCD